MLELPTFPSQFSWIFDIQIALNDYELIIIQYRLHVVSIWKLKSTYVLFISIQNKAKHYYI